MAIPDSCEHAMYYRPFVCMSHIIKTVTNQECKVAFSERKNAEADAYALTRNESNLLALRLAPTKVVTRMGNYRSP